MKISIRTRLRKDGKEYLFLDYYHQGKRRQESLSLSFNPKDKKEKRHQFSIADRIKRKKLTQYENDEFDFLDTSRRDKFFLPYFEMFADKNESHYNTLQHLKRYSNKRIRFRDIDEIWLRGFSDYLLNKTSLHNNSASFYFRKFREILYKASKEGYIKRTIIENVKNIKRIETKREFLTIDEIEKLAITGCKNNEIKRAFLFSCFTGLRQIDIKRLKWSHIVNHEIRIRQQKTKDYVIIPLSQSAKQLIYSNEKNNINNEYIFSLPNQRSTINRSLVTWFKKAEIKKTGIYHISRHSFATMLITKERNLYEVKELLGHKDIRNTQIYANLVNTKRKDATDSLPIIEMNFKGH